MLNSTSPKTSPVKQQVPEFFCRGFAQIHLMKVAVLLLHHHHNFFLPLFFCQGAKLEGEYFTLQFCSYKL